MGSAFRWCFLVKESLWGVQDGKSRNMNVSRPDWEGSWTPGTMDYDNSWDFVMSLSWRIVLSRITWQTWGSDQHIDCVGQFHSTMQDKYMKWAWHIGQIFMLTDFSVGFQNRIKNTKTKIPSVLNRIINTSTQPKRFLNRWLLSLKSVFETHITD